MRKKVGVAILKFDNIDFIKITIIRDKKDITY